MEGTIIETLTKHYHKDAKSLLEKVQRDTRYRSRYNVVFKNSNDCNDLKENGITIAGQRIKGNKERKLERAISQFYVPNFPAWGTKEELVELLSQYGQVKYCRERLHQTYRIPIGGWIVGLSNVKEDQPTEIMYENEPYRVVNTGKGGKEREKERQFLERQREYDQKREQAQHQQQQDQPPPNNEQQPATPPTEQPLPNPIVHQPQPTAMEEDHTPIGSPKRDERDLSPPLTDDEEKELEHLQRKRFLAKETDLMRYIELNNRVYANQPSPANSVASQDSSSSSCSQDSVKSTAESTSGVQVKRSKHRKDKPNKK